MVEPRYVEEELINNRFPNFSKRLICCKNGIVFLGPKKLWMEYWASQDSVSHQERCLGTGFWSTMIKCPYVWKTDYLRIEICSLGTWPFRDVLPRRGRLIIYQLTSWSGRSHGEIWHHWLIPLDLRLVSTSVWWNLKMLANVWQSLFDQCLRLECQLNNS